MRFRSDIEGLRAVAVIAVVLYHCGLDVARGGYVGVDVFFVLSGFLITSLMLSEIEATSRLSFSGFYGRRARRLLPAATMVIACTVFVGWSVLSPLARKDLVGDALGATTYSLNWRLAQRGADYFQGEMAPSALQHYWSLAVEEQFYIVWPALIAVLVGRRFRRGVLVIGVGVVVVGSFIACQIVTARSQSWAFFGLHTRMWQLGTGALTAIAWRHVERLPSIVRRIGPVAGLAAIAYAVIAYSDTTSWPGTAALVPTFGALGVIIGSAAAPSHRLLSTTPMVWIGVRSYSWYLWHWPALVLVAAWRGQPLSTGLAVIVAAVSLVVGHVGFVLVERPIRHGRILVVSARRSIAVGLAFSLTCLVALAALRPSAGQVGATGATASTEAVADGLPATLEAAAATLNVPANLQPPLAEARDPKWLPAVYELGCHVDIPSVDPKICEFGDVGGVITAVLLGDSHAAQWFPTLDSLGARSGIRVVPLTKSGCGAADVLPFNSRLNRAYTECVQWRANVFDLLDTVRPDIVIVAQFALVNPDGVAANERNDVVLDGWISTLSRLVETGAGVIVIADTPMPAGDPPDCLSAHLESASECTNSRERALAHRSANLEQQAAAATGVRLVDPAPLVCGPTVCPVIVGNLLVYRDPSHLTMAYVHWLEPALAALLGSPWIAASD